MAPPSLPKPAPAWLAAIAELEAEIEPAAFNIEKATFQIVKTMVLARGGNNNNNNNNNNNKDDDAEKNKVAVARAAAEIRGFYATALFPPGNDFYRLLEGHGVGHTVGAVVGHVFHMARVIPWREPAHVRLADLLVALKDGAAAEFDPAVRSPCLLTYLLPTWPSPSVICPTRNEAQDTNVVSGLRRTHSSVGNPSTSTGTPTKSGTRLTVRIPLLPFLQPPNSNILVSTIPSRNQTHLSLPPYLPTYLPTCLPTCLPTYLPTYPTIPYLPS